MTSTTYTIAVMRGSTRAISLDHTGSLAEAKTIAMRLSAKQSRRGRPVTCIIWSQYNTQPVFEALV